MGAGGADGRRFRTALRKGEQVEFQDANRHGALDKELLCHSEFMRLGSQS